jgi:hypothetical protein
VSPVRIQRKRTKGWRMPEGAVYVGRPSRWGNPFVGEEWYDLDLSLRLYDDVARGIWDPLPLRERDVSDAVALSIYGDSRRWTRRFRGGHPREAIRYELSGRDLVCWCPLDQPCHADVLLELANPERSGE